MNEVIGRLFAMMKPNSIMVTLEELQCLGRSNYEENAYREIQGLDEHIDASFFNYEEVKDIQKAVGWSDKPRSVFVYRRLAQSCEYGKSYFLCRDKNCKGLNLPTAVINDSSIDLLCETCVYCKEKRLSTSRTRKKTDRFVDAKTN